MYTNYIVNPTNTSFNLTHISTEINRAEIIGPNIIRLGNQNIITRSFNNDQVGYHRVGFFQEGSWIEVLPAFDSNFVTFGNIISPAEVSDIETFNDLIRNDQAIRVNLDILEDRTRTMISLTLDRGIQIYLEGGEALCLSVLQEADISEHLIETIEFRDHSITTYREELQPYIQSIERIYNMNNVQFNREHHRDMLLGHVNRYYKIQQALHKIYGIESNN